MSAYRFRFWGSGPPEMTEVVAILKSYGAKLKKKDRYGSLFLELKRDNYIVQMRTRPKGDIFECRRLFRRSFKWLPIEGPIQIHFQTLECCSVEAVTVIGRVSAEISRLCGRGMWLDAIGGTHFNMLMDEAISDLNSLFEFRIRRLAQAIGRDTIPPIACRTSEQCEKYLTKLIAE